jgi:DNA-binding Xre family transcriptional regulator
MEKKDHRGISRSRRLTKAEAAKYRKMREHVETEVPPLKPAPLKVAIAKLRALREAKGVSLSELAARTSIPRGTLERLEIQKSATLKTLQRYAEGLDCELEINVVSADVKRRQREAVG